MLRRTRSLSCLVLLCLTLAASAATADSAESSQTWLGPDGNPLPFENADELLAFFQTAPIVETKELSDGINRPTRLTFEDDGVRVRAIFRTVDVSRPSNSTPLERQFPSFRDCYIYEVAAWEMSRLLGLDNVPPAAPYEWNGRHGSIQLWIERATSESRRIAAGTAPVDPARWQRQRLDMIVFDSLIYNFDRNHGNQLVDETGKLWFIDHTRSFKRTPSLPTKSEIALIDQALWDRLRQLDPQVIRERMKPYLNKVEIEALLKRRTLLIRHVERLIADRGELHVLINVAPRAGNEAPAATAL